MPLRPQHPEPELPEALARYADRVAELSKAGRVVGYIRVEPEASSTQVGGRLWWRRWGPYRWAVRVWLSGAGLDPDAMVQPEDVPAELADWDAGRFRLRGDVLDLRWLAADEAAEVVGSAWAEDN
ncbi:hypothetical protein [Kribbella deserti]|uniref:Uncharacterized protein n=1 Tax=Kribbella deserti TaxID=1926257 RepID=A0ABV6QHT6_9ACTN